MIQIAIDAMGGDFAPEEIVLGGIQAAREFHISVVLVGDKEQIEPILRRENAEHDPLISVHHASQVIEMDEHPGLAFRKKKDASVSVAASLVRSGECGAMVAPGSTGAAVAAGLLGIGRISGIERPAILTPIPNMKGGHTFLIDSGASAQPNSENLVQNALLGYWYARLVHHIQEPRVGLLNIGEESIKGSPVAAETFAKLSRQKAVPFAGNAEGRDIPSGKFDVIVTDGFTGNVVLKFAEGLSTFFMQLVKDSISEGGLVAKLGALAVHPALKRGMMKKIDYAEYGGAPLLGIRGGLVICHGASRAKAIKNAVGLAERICNERVCEVIAAAVGDINTETLEQKMQIDAEG